MGNVVAGPTHEQKDLCTFLESTPKTFQTALSIWILLEFSLPKFNHCTIPESFSHICLHAKLELLCRFKTH